jgi:hypothetical protein
MAMGTIVAGLNDCLRDVFAHVPRYNNGRRDWITYDTLLEQAVENRAL